MISTKNAALIVTLSVTLVLGIFSSASFALTPSMHPATTVEAEAYGYHTFYTYSSGDSFSKTTTMSQYGGFTFYDYNQSFTGPEIIYTAPVTLSYESQSYTQSQAQSNGNTRYWWNETTTTLTAGSSFSVSFEGSGTFKSPITVSRTATPSTLSCTAPCTTKVVVIASIAVEKLGAPNVCTYVSDYTNANTSSKLISVSGLGPANSKMQIIQGDDYASICTSNVSGGTLKLKSVWEVTKYVSGTISWRPNVEGAENSYVYCYSGTCYQAAQKPYDTLTNNTAQITYGNNWLHKSSFEFTSSTSTNFYWYYVYFSSYLYEDLFNVHS